MNALIARDRQALDEMGIDCPTHLVNGYKHGWITHNFLMEESKGMQHIILSDGTH